MTQSQVEEVAEFHTSRNTHPFVLRFPTEILENIFIHCARDCYYEHRHCIDPTVPCRIEISYVCRHWRHIVLACPTFWTYGFITSQRWTEELLARSKQASLRIRANLQWSQDPFQLLIPLEKALDHVERIQELRLQLPASCTNQIISRLFSHAPRLQALEITVEDQESLHWPSLLFQGHTPALRTLELSGCPALLHSFKLNALTTLDLDDVPHRFRPSMEEFLSTLRGLQDLKHLYLYRALAAGFPSGAVFKSSEKIDLPHLSRLSITAPLLTVVTFFSCVNIPLKTEVKLGCESDLHFSSDNYHLLNSLLTERYSLAKDQTAATQTFLSLFITYSEWTSAIFSFSAYRHDTIPVPDDDRNNNIPLEVNMELCGIDNHLVVSNICCSLPLSNLQSLVFNKPPFSSAFWRNMLGHLQGVRYIKLDWGNMPDLSLLSESSIHLTGNHGMREKDAPTVCDQNQSPMFAPQLEELVLEGIVFARDGDGDLPEPAITLRRLFDILSKRKGSQGRLTMTECEIGGNSVDLVMTWGDSDDRKENHDDEEERKQGWWKGKGSE